MSYYPHNCYCLPATACQLGHHHRTAEKSSSGGGSSSSAAAPLPPDLARIKLLLWAEYRDRFLASLLPHAARLDLVVAAAELARLVLGSSGGFGHDWGLKITPDGMRLQRAPELAPYFQVRKADPGSRGPGVEGFGV